MPQDSKWFDIENYVRPRLGVQEEYLNLLFEAPDGGNILSSAALRDMFEVKSIVDAIETEFEGEKHTLASICREVATGEAPLHACPGLPDILHLVVQPSQADQWQIQGAEEQCRCWCARDTSSAERHNRRLHSLTHSRQQFLTQYLASKRLCYACLP